MNIYDFDKTIYAKDSSVEFLFFALKNQTTRVLPAFLRFAIIYFLYKLKITSKIQAKEAMFGFLPKIKNPNQLIEKFWQNKTLDNWYIKQQQASDVIISASPRFLITPILKRNHIKHIIASEVDLKTGKFSSKNCYGQEKIIRFQTEYPNSKVDSAYSDSMSDQPMLNLANHQYLICRKHNSSKVAKIKPLREIEP